MPFGDMDYLSLVDGIGPSFASEGWADGYAELPDNSVVIIKQLYGKVPNDKLIEYVVEYLNGYEIGADMSEYIEDVYDEDGNIRDGWADATPILDHESDAILLVKKHIKTLRAEIKR